MKLFTPSEYVKSVFKVSLLKLKKMKIKNLLLDIDNTIIPLRKKEIETDFKNWVISTKKKGFKMCFVSNSIRVARAKKIAKKLNVPLLTLALKPLPFSFLKALKILNSKRSEAVIIGDQLFTDIVGGNLCGIYTILVKPVSEEKVWYRKFMRWLEGFFFSSKP